MALFMQADAMVAGISPGAAQLKDWDRLIEVRGEVLKILRQRGKTSSLAVPGSQSQIAAKSGTLEILKKYQDSLPALFIVSQVEIKDELPKGTHFLIMENCRF